MELPINAPDFSQDRFQNFPDVNIHIFEEDGRITSVFYSGKNYPTYIKVDGKWCFVKDQRMDGFIVWNEQRNHWDPPRVWRPPGW